MVLSVEIMSERNELFREFESISCETNLPGQGKSTALLSANVNVLSTPPRLLVTR